MNDLDIGWRSALLMSLFIPQLLLTIKLMLKPVERKASVMLGLFLLVYSLTNLPQIIGFMGAYQLWPGLTFAPFSIELFLGPFLLLHMHCLTSKKSIGTMWFLLVPGFLQLSYYSTVFLWFDDYRDKWAFNDAFHRPFIHPLEIFMIVLITALCGWLINKKVKEYRIFLKSTQSNIEPFDPRWLNQLLWIFSTVLVIWLLYVLADNYWYPMNYQGEFPFHLLMSFVVLWKVHEGLCHLFEHYPKPDNHEKNSEQTPPSKDWSVLMKKVNTADYDHELYLQPKLTITQLARTLGSNETYISRALNQFAGVNFNEFINQARINTAKEMMVKHHDKSLLDIALSVGFSSKSTFNRLFKKKMGQTPSHYRNSQEQ